MNPNDPQHAPYQPTPQPGQASAHQGSPADYHTGQMSHEQQQDYTKPVAYDQQGRPLYAHPPAGTGHGYPAHPSHQPSVVHISRPINPVDQPIPPEILARHEESQKKYPQLNLSRGEYVINAVKRHPIGVLQIWFIVVLLILLFGATYAMLFLGQSPSELLSEGLNQEQSGAGLLLLALSVLIVMGGVVATYIYNANRFYLTNESVIQEIQTTLFSRHEQTVSLSNIEDASYKQNGVLPMIFDFGTIRLSTEGDETTYSFSYVAKPKKHIAVLNNAVEAFKNGRPVD